MDLLSLPLGDLIIATYVALQLPSTRPNETNEHKRMVEEINKNINYKYQVITHYNIWNSIKNNH